MKIESTASLLTMGLFAVGAVSLIVYQHRSATAQITSQLSGGISANGVNAAADTGASASWLGSSASLAGSPTVGQDGYSSTPAVVPLGVGPGYYLQ